MAHQATRHRPVFSQFGLARTCPQAGPPNPRSEWTLEQLSDLVQRTHALFDAMAQLRYMVLQPLLSEVLSWPSWVLIALITAVITLAGYCLHGPLMRRNEKASSPDHSEIAGHFLGVIGVIYAVLLAFVVVTAWQQFDHAEEISMQEQRDVADLFDLAGAYQMHPAESSDIRSTLASYALGMIVEMKQMGRNEPLCAVGNFANEIDLDCQPDDGKGRPYGVLPASRLNDDLVTKLRIKIMSLRLTTGADQALYRQSLVLFEDFLGARDHRRHHYDEPMPFVLWLAFAIGGFITICLPYVGHGRRDRDRQLARTLALCLMIGLIIGLTFVFDHPFRGDGAVEGVAQWCSTAKRLNSEINPGVLSPGCAFDRSDWRTMIWL